MPPFKSDLSRTAIASAAMPPNTPQPAPPPQPMRVSPLKPGPQVSAGDHLTMTSPLTSPQAETFLFRQAYNHEITRIHAQQNVDSTSEAHSVIKNIIHRQISEDIWPYIKIAREISMSELRDIGRMGRREGIRGCGTLIRVPGIHDKAAGDLWEGLRVHMGMVDGEDDEQDMFERDIVMRMQKEQEEERNDGTAEEKWKARGEARKCVLCTGCGPGCRLPSDTPEKYLRETDGQEVLWQREERCPRQSRYREGKSRPDITPDDHILGTSNEGHWATGLSSPFAPSTPSIRSRVSQIFVWGRREERQAD
ncbi:hypothetical protein GE09DRAFT_289647 [Coniochaeta sp. 2T2.1]|nr:hypothetical protein GE09DRAFT_289647 [Coniochaeta sp. 2T2.1]